MNVDFIVSKDRERIAINTDGFGVDADYYLDVDDLLELLKHLGHKVTFKIVDSVDSEEFDAVPTPIRVD